MRQPVNTVEDFVARLFRLPTEEKLRIINALQTSIRDDVGYKPSADSTERGKSIVTK